MEKKRLNTLVYVGYQWSFEEKSFYHLRRPQASSRSPKGEEALRPPWSNLRSPGKICRLGEYPCSRWEFSQKGKERVTRRNQSFQKLIRFLYFQVCLYTFFLYIGMNTESGGVSRPDPCQNQVLHIKLYKGLSGFTSSSSHEACWHFMALSDNGQSTRNLIFSRGDFFLKLGATLQIKLHSYGVRV